MVDQLQRVIDNLKDGVFVTYEALNNEDQGYPYATGYARSTMRDSIERLQQLLEQIQEDEAND